MSDIVKDLILKKTQYVSGSKGKLPDDAFSISASQLGKNTLEIYLTMIYGPQPEIAIGDATLGTIFHKGMEEYVKEIISEPRVGGDPTFRTEVSRHHEMRKNWYLTGTSDLEAEHPDWAVQIRDYKLTKVYAGTMYKKDPRRHTYGIQASALTYLFKRGPGNSERNVTNIIDFFYKDANRMKMESTHEPIEHIPHTPEEVEIMFDTKSRELQTHIENATIPGVCDDLWPRKVPGKSQTINTKCEFYCGQKNNCPYYKDSGKHGNTNVQLIAGW